MNIALLDDQEIVRIGVRHELQTTNHVITIDASSSAEFFKALVEGTPCDLVLLDLLMPDINGIEVAQRLRAEYPDIKIIVYSVDTKEYIITQIMAIGIEGFISKNGPTSEIRAAIESVEEGVPFYGKDVAALIRDVVDARMTKRYRGLLTHREIEIVQACCSGLVGKEIADTFHISLRAVNSHKTNIFNKLGLKSTVDMVRFAIEHGII